MAIAETSSLDWGAVGSNLVVLLAAVAATIGGIRTGIKKLKKGDLEPTPTTAAKSVASAMLMETTSMLMWSESNRDVVESNKDLIDEIKELRQCVSRLTEELRIAAAISGRQERSNDYGGR